MRSLTMQSLKLLMLSLCLVSCKLNLDPYVIDVNTQQLINSEGKSIDLRDPHADGRICFTIKEIARIERACNNRTKLD